MQTNARNCKKTEGLMPDFFQTFATCVSVSELKCSMFVSREQICSKCKTNVKIQST